MRVPEEKLKQIEDWTPRADEGDRIAKAAALTKSLVADIRDLQARLAAATTGPYARTIREVGDLPVDAGTAAGSKTSALSAQALAGKLGELQQRVLDFIRIAGDDGVTDEEIEVVLEMARHTVTPRRRELVLGGLVRDTGRTRIAARTGRAITVWCAVQL